MNLIYKKYLMMKTTLYYKWYADRIKNSDKMKSLLTIPTIFAYTDKC